MYCVFFVGSWVCDSNPEATAIGCGSSVMERIVADSVEWAVQQYKDKYPNSVKCVSVHCKALGINNMKVEW